MDRKKLIFVIAGIAGGVFLVFLCVAGIVLWIWFSHKKADSVSGGSAQNSQITDTSSLSLEDLGKYAGRLNFASFTDNLSLDRNTSMHVSFFWQKAKGQRVSWSGNVVDVRGGRGKVEITVNNKSKPAYRGYNIVLVTYQQARAAELKKGDLIKFSGDVYNYKGRKGHPVVVYLNNVDITSK